MTAMTKSLLILTTMLFFYGCASNKIDQFTKTDNTYKNHIIGTWVVDTERQEPYPYPAYIEYFKDGTTKLRVFEDNSCQNEIETVHLFWRIYNGYLYYKDVNELNWSEDEIIEFTDSHHVLLSKGETLYRKRGNFCNKSEIKP